MAELLQERVEVNDVPNAADLVRIVQDTPSHDRDVRIEDVSFRYADGGGGVSHLSLRIPPGGSVALVGPSGSGKSTCTRLLCRLFDAQGGAIRICGWDVRDVTQHSLRTVVSCVTQDTGVEPSTIDRPP